MSDARFDHIDEEIAKLRRAVDSAKESLCALTVNQGREQTWDNLRELQFAVRELLYPGVFEDLRSAGIGTREAVNRLETVSARMKLVRWPAECAHTWSRLETKGD